ncbi:MAG: hypothetical protein KDI06_21330, partial [Calditrichaeota bacterium]|nr:hypothetical protein [Calditrichota bacterium]
MTHGCVWALLCLFLVSCSGSLQQKAATPYEEDIALLKTRLKADPSDLKTVQQLGILFYRAGQYKNAITTLGKAHDRDPQDPLSLAYLGLSLEENGSIADAIGMYGRFQDLSEAGEYYYWLKGRQLLAQKRLDHLQLARDLLAFDGLATPVWQEGRVAIAALTYYGEDSRYAGLGLVLAEMLTRRMGEVGIPNLIPVEKISLYNSLAELPPFSENLDPSAKTLGQFFAAPIVLTGGYNIIDGNVVADFTVWDVRSSEEPRRVTRLGSL